MQQAVAVGGQCIEDWSEDKRETGAGSGGWRAKRAADHSAEAHAVDIAAQLADYVVSSRVR